MENYTVVVTDDRYASYVEEEGVLRKIGAELVVRDFRSAGEAIEGLAEADGVLVNLFPLTADVISAMKRCRVISRYGVGYDNVDVDAATRAGIQVTRVPDYSIEDVSDQALALLLCCVRKVAYKDRRIRAGGWNLHKNQPAHRIAGRVLGLVGFGAIARALCRKVSGLGLARVLAFDPFVDDEAIRAGGADPADLDTIYARSDFLSVHVPLNDGTRKMIGPDAIAKMKDDAILVNTSRGPVLDEAAVAEALRSGRLGYAGLDVFETEPLPADSPLRDLDNVILSDHAGWYSEESLVELKTKAARNVAEVLAGRRPTYPVNKV